MKLKTKALGLNMLVNQSDWLKLTSSHRSRQAIMNQIADYGLIMWYSLGRWWWCDCLFANYHS